MKHNKFDSMKIQLKGANNHGADTFWFPVIREDVKDPSPNSEVPTSQYFSEGNGGEYRYTVYIYISGLY